MSDYILAGVILLAFVGVMLFISYKGYKKSSKVKKARAAISGRLGATMNGTLKHTEGLPLAPGVMVDVYYGPQKIVFKKDGQEISIAREKVTGIDVTTGKNIKAQQMAGAVTGKYVIGGTTGAIIGSLAATTTYLVISYTSEGENKFIILDTAASGTFALKVQKDYAQTSTARASSIEL